MRTHNIPSCYRQSKIYSYYASWPGDMINTTLCLCFTAQKECCAQSVMVPFIFMSAGLALNENTRGNSNIYIFWLKLRNENLSKLYETWRNQTPMILPQQIQMLKINGEPDDQRRRREKQVLDNYKTERDLLELRAQSHEEKYKRLDEEMISIISENATGRCKDILVTLWYEDTNKEEEISKKRWKSKNEVWLKNMKLTSV